MRFATTRLVARSDAAPRTASALRSTTVAKRVYRFEMGLGASEPLSPREHRHDVGTEIQTWSPSQSESYGRVFADDQLRRGAPSAPFVDHAHHSPSERHFRAPPEAEALPPPPPTPKPAQPESRPEVDVGKLERVMWQRFEKRIRIEQERRGRT